MTSITVRHYKAAGDSDPQASILYPLAADIANQNVLLVDDVNDTGDTLQLAWGYLFGLGPRELKTAVLHEKQNSILRVDFKAESVSEWRWII
jgi:hypoxanthine phosphoribosyltransferase